MRFAPPQLREVGLVAGIMLLVLTAVVSAQVIINNQVRILGGVGGRIDVLGTTGADGFTVKKVSSDTAIAMEEFERYCEKQEFEKAFSTLPALADATSSGLVDVGNGLYMPIRARFRQVLVGLSPSGREAYRVFNDAPARQGLAGLVPEDHPEAPPVTNEVPRLQELFDKYFITAVGDRIGDRLGDAKFETGEFSAAAACWEAVLRDFPDSTLSAMRLHVKRAIALARARRWNDFNAAAKLITDKYGSERIRLGTDDVSVKTLMENLAAAMPMASAPPVEAGVPGPIRMPQAEEPLWQCVFADDTYLAEVDRLSKNQGLGATSFNPMMISPRAVADDKRIYLNWFGIFMAIDAQTGKLLHRSSPFQGMANSVQLATQMGFDSGGDQSIIMIPRRERVLVTAPVNSGRPQVLQGAGGAYVRTGTSQLTCYNTSTLQALWKSETSGLATWTILGTPLLDGDTIYVAGRSLTTAAGSSNTTMDLNLLAVDMNSGRLLWALPLGTMSSGINPRLVVSLPRPVMVRSGDRIYIQTGDKAVVAVNLLTRNVEWAYAWSKPVAAQGQPAAQGQIYRQVDPLQCPSSIAISDAGLFVKDRNSATLYAIDPGKPALMWEQPIELSTSIVGADEKSVYLLGRQLDCLDLQTRQLRWSSRLPGVNGSGELLRIGSRLYIYSARGLYEVNQSSGDVKQFPGYEREGFGGSVVRVGDRLISISNRAVTAYAMPGQ